MKNLSTFILALSIVLGTATACAQNYRPFRFGLTYQLSASGTAGDTTHLLRLASRQPAAVAGDTLFLFAKRASRGWPQVQQGNCGAFVQRPDNLFGTSMRVHAATEFVLTAANGHTFTLRPRAPLGQAWTATAAGLTAQVSARTLGTVLGQPDSLATITLSDGAVIMLSKRFGWVSGPALGSYLNSRLPQSYLTLTALPGLGLGTSQLGALAIYDFQPGDVFLRKTVTSGQAAPCQYPSVQWTRDSVISRTPSANGTVLDYQILTRTLGRPCGATTPVIGAPSTQNLHITETSNHLDQPTGFWEPYITAPTAGLVHLPAWRTADYNNRPVQRHMGYLQCATAADTTSLRDASSLDAGYSSWTAPGLGQTRVESISFSLETTTLVGYRKGTETWGQLFTFSQLLAARDSRPASTTAAFPNPFGAGLTVGFTLTRPQPVGVVLRDALGRVVLEKAARPWAAGAQQFSLATAALPVGVYSLHLHFAGENRTEVLKVLKTQ
ncbi:hypothetical protein [Hymenobacter daeguensis]